MMKSKIPYFVIIGLFIIIGIQSQCNRPAATAEPEILTVIDTTYIYDTDTIYIDTGKLVKRTAAKSVPQQRIADTSCIGLKLQYSNLLADFLADYEYQDTIRKDSSYIVANCHVSGNSLINCSYYWHSNYPVVTTTHTITLPSLAKRQVFIGGDVGSNLQLNALQVNAGMLYKNRRDNLYGFTVGTDTRGTGVNYKLQSYWKISFKRNP